MHFKHRWIVFVQSFFIQGEQGEKCYVNNIKQKVTLSSSAGEEIFFPSQENFQDFEKLSHPESGKAKYVNLAELKSHNISG